MAHEDFGLGVSASDEGCLKKLLAVFLLLLGMGLLVGGLDVVVRREKYYGLALVFLGAMVLIPGVYHCSKFAQEFRSKQGFDTIPNV